MKKYNGTTWVDTTLRQYKTATANIEPTIYTDGTAITAYTIKGNTVQDGTPTPSNPVEVQGVGELDSGQYKIPISSGQTALNPIYLTEPLMKIGDTVDSLASAGTVTYNIKKLVLTGEEEFSFAYSTAILPMTDYKAGNTIIYTCTHYIAQEPITSATSLNADSFAFNPYANTRRLYIKDSVHNTLESFIQFLKDEYAAGRPVTVYYILATAQTETVTAPSIPTTEGANSITVDTTVQPSEFTATWTGWHNNLVKEYDGSDWQ